jgi:hypothetical protein
MRRAVWLRVLVLVAACVALAGCEKLMGRAKLVPDRGPLEGSTEVSIYVPECGDHSKVKEVLFDSVKQAIVSLKEDEVKIRTASSQQGEKKAKVTLVLPNQFKCETGAIFNYVKMEASTMNYLFEKGVIIGERRVGGYRPDLAAEE